MSEPCVGAPPNGDISVKSSVSVIKARYPSISPRISTAFDSADRWMSSVISFSVRPSCAMATSSSLFRIRRPTLADGGAQESAQLLALILVSPRQRTLQAKTILTTPVRPCETPPHCLAAGKTGGPAQGLRRAGHHLA